MSITLPGVSRALPWLVLLGVSAFWGAAFPIIRYLVEWVSPSDLLVARFFPTAVLILPLVLFTYRPALCRVYPRLWWLFLLLAVLWLFGYHLLLNLGETVLSAGTAGLIVSTYPVFTVFLAAAFRMERLSAAKVVGGLVAFAATAFLTLSGAGQAETTYQVQPAQWIRYSLLTLITPVVAAAQTLMARPYLIGRRANHEPVDPFVMSLGYMLPAGILSLSLWRPGLASDLAAVPTGFWPALSVLVVFSTLLATMGWFWALTRVEAGPAAISTFVIPIFSLAYSWAFLGEPIGPPELLGAGGIIAGVAIATLGRSPERATAAQAPIGRGSRR
jgi:drug/metabolite transporter (DMT)-like permease